MKKGFKILLFLTLLYGCRTDEKIILKNDIQLFKFKAHLDEDGNIGCLNAFYGFDIKDTCLRNYLTKNIDMGERELGFFSSALDSSDFICNNNKYSNLDTFEIVFRKPTE
ncbi:MAG: hypothetical protein NTU43_08875, partial [Bacteroidetes bacterium]|nr:hypothetical protein [Bacteroidota bacterium]